jgi:V/A-type H+-transporting ATPase subunit E
MALEDILRKIREDAAAQVEGILAEARAERERRQAAAQARAQATGERIRAGGQATAQEVHRRELATASVEARRVVLAAKQRVLDEVFERALDGLANLPDQDYRQLLADLAVQAAGTGREQVVVSPRDRSRLDGTWLLDVNRRLAGRGLEPGLTLAAHTRPLRGGLVLDAGDLEVNCSFERTLAALREQLEPEVAASLFRDQAAPEARP